MHSAAWRISAWATAAYAVGTLIVFVSLHRFVAMDIERRSDAWLSGEVEVLGDVAEHTPKGALYERAVEEVAELATREVPNREDNESADNASVFFLAVNRDQVNEVWVGPGKVTDVAGAIRHTLMLRDQPSDVLLPGRNIPYRVAMTRLSDGGTVYLGLSERDQKRVLANLRNQFALVWLLVVGLGYGIVFSATRRMLNHVRRISEAASSIGHSDLSERVPVSSRNDEVSQLAVTINGMLDRIEESMRQLHTITDSLAHDLRSPLTAIRGKLEVSLSAEKEDEQLDAIISSIEALDRLADFLNTSLDVAEARADALRLHKTRINLEELLRSMIDLYEPSIAEFNMKIDFECNGPVWIDADAALTHRLLANLFDNELKHLPKGSSIRIRFREDHENVAMQIEDNGPGFPAELLDQIFEKRIRGSHSKGHGLGLAFVGAVVRAHRGTVHVRNLEPSGASISISFPPAGQS